MARSNIFVVSIVAVVAVVGLVTMFLQGGTGGAPLEQVMVDEQGNLLGEAIQYKQFAYNQYAAKPRASRRETLARLDASRVAARACPTCRPVHVRLYGSGTQRLADAAGYGVTNIITFNNDGWDNSLALHSIWLAEPRIPEEPGRPAGSVTLMVRPDREESGIWPLTLRAGESRDVVFGSTANRFTVNIGLVEIVGKHNYVVLKLTRR